MLTVPNPAEEKGGPINTSFPLFKLLINKNVPMTTDGVQETNVKMFISVFALIGLITLGAVLQCVHTVTTRRLASPLSGAIVRYENINRESKRNSI